ncbi:MAG TPA: hypothetical protein VHO70_02385 [Chitinispirillaceae bacterium]|nr:hypothetical protein [Chitinispirillaceae bacterium]
MRIDSLNSNSIYQPGSGNSQSVSIEQKIEKLENIKRKIQEDLTKRSTNPDPKAAQGDNAANSSVNRKILQQLEQQIQTLEQRRDCSKNVGSSDNNLKGNATSGIRSDYTGNNVDLLA